MGQPDAPSTCLECGSENIKPTSNKSGQFVCSDCGLVVERRDTSKLDIDMDWKEKYAGGKEDSEFTRARWSEQTSTAIVGLIREPNRTHQEYYRIENPREFFENCSSEQDELQKIKNSNLEPFETVDLPHIEWRYSTH